MPPLGGHESLPFALSAHFTAACSASHGVFCVYVFIWPQVCRCPAIGCRLRHHGSCCALLCPAVPAVQDEDVLDTWFSSGLFPFSGKTHEPASDGEHLRGVRLAAPVGLPRGACIGPALRPCAPMCLPPPLSDVSLNPTPRPRLLFPAASTSLPTPTPLPPLRPSLPQSSSGRSRPLIWLSFTPPPCWRRGTTSCSSGWLAW